MFGIIISLFLSEKCVAVSDACRQFSETMQLRVPLQDVFTIEQLLRRGNGSFGTIQVCYVIFTVP